MRRPLLCRSITSPGAPAGHPGVPAEAAGTDGTFMALLSFAPEAAALVRRLQDFCAQHHIEAYLVGGAVRDAVAPGAPGYKPVAASADIDIAVTAQSVAPVAEALGRLLRASVVRLDAERQFTRIVPREGGMYVDVAPIRGDILADLVLRDFTINALAIPLSGLDLRASRGLVIDPLTGVDDLRTGTVRACGDSVFADDPLRLLRGPRLAAELGFAIEPATQEQVRRDAHLLAHASGERVRDEFCRILAAPRVTAHLRQLDNLHLLMQVLPEMEESRDVGQPKEHYWDVLNHSLEAVGRMEQVLRQTPGDRTLLAHIPWDEDTAAYFRQAPGGGTTQAPSGGRSRLVLGKLAALLHDVAKPATKTIEPSGRMRFLGHPVKGAEVSDRIMERLRFSNRETRIVSMLVREHLRPGLISRGNEPPSRRAMFRFFRDADDAVLDTLYLSFADYMAARGPLIEPEDWRLYTARICHILADWKSRVSTTPKVRLIDGHDIMRTFSLLPGPHLRTLLDTVTESQAAGEITSRTDALCLVENLLKHHDSAERTPGKV